MRATLGAFLSSIGVGLTVGTTQIHGPDWAISIGIVIAATGYVIAIVADIEAM